MSDKKDYDLESDIVDPNLGEEALDAEEQSEEQQYSFLKETIKEDKRKRIFSKHSIGRMVSHGFIFGTFACLSFFMFRPWFNSIFIDDTRPVVPIVLELPEEIEIPEPPDEPEEPEEPEEPVEGEEDEPEEVILVELTAESYQEIIDSITDIADTANRSIAYIEGVDEEFDLIDEARIRSNRVTGLIMGDNSSELMIVAHNRLIGSYNQFRVILADESVHEGRLVIQDNTRGLAVFGIDKEHLSEETLENIEYANIGSSNRTRQGMLVIAVGNILGHGDGKVHGFLASNQSFETITDGRFRILGTDIITSGQGTGVLFNRDGQVIGLLMPGPWQRNDQITANVLGISDLFPIIQILVNGDPVPYLGVEGITITEELSAAFEIPPGVYVRQILGDSPAMNGRIHNGDVIIAVNGYEVLNKESLVSSILSSDIGMTIEVTVKRRGAVEYEIMTLPVIIGNRD